ncbi:DUF6673 family protein [Acetobacterium bakii]|uniref:DUF6673 domain-containing protein n=1 Tax=Acetobacterium bakii TaxID=52689 RepID=A0A0L6TYY7_9FIRM|nr:DUF6673 family protein [Acetobacterium bakii]KNZ41458.1 hypothetical protein AKG39_11860 [Acetobacterium bakii]
MIINGIELELDVMDVNTADKFQNMVETLFGDYKKCDQIGDILRQRCMIINEIFDGMFGEGAADAVLPGEMNLTNSFAALEEIVNEFVKLPDKMIEAQRKCFYKIEKESELKLLK